MAVLSCIYILDSALDCTYLDVGTVLFYYKIFQELPQSLHIANFEFEIFVDVFVFSLYLDFYGVNAQRPPVANIMPARPALLPARVTTLFFLTSFLPEDEEEVGVNVYSILKL